MRASIGDKLHIHTNHLGSGDHIGRIAEIRGADGAPPYLVEFPDGHTRLVFPGPDAVVEAAQPVGAVSATSGSAGTGSAGPTGPAGAAVKAGERAMRRMHTRVGW